MGSFKDINMQSYYYGCDYSIINAARVSFNKDGLSVNPVKDIEKDKNLFQFLYDQGHYSVFEHIWFYISKRELPERFEYSYFNPDNQIFKCSNHFIFSGRTMLSLFPFLSDELKEKIQSLYPALYSVIEGKAIKELSDREYNIKYLEKTDSGTVGLVDYFIFKECPKYSIFTFVIECPIFVARQWMRHRFGSYNELSRRYTKSDIRYYTPEYEIVNEKILSDTLKEKINNLYSQIDCLYKELIENGVKKEVARIILPVSTYTRFYWSVFKTSIDNFLRLRTKEDAQYEIRVLAKSIDKIVTQVFKF